MLAAAQRKQRALAAAAVADQAAEEEAAEKAKAAEVERLQAVVSATVGCVQRCLDRDGSRARSGAGPDDDLPDAAGPRRGGSRSKASGGAGSDASADYHEAQSPPPISDASLDRARAEMQQASKRKRA